MILFRSKSDLNFFRTHLYIAQVYDSHLKVKFPEDFLLKGDSTRIFLKLRWNFTSIINQIRLVYFAWKEKGFRIMKGYY